MVPKAMSEPSGATYQVVRQSRGSSASATGGRAPRPAPRGGRPGRLQAWRGGPGINPSSVLQSSGGRRVLQPVVLPRGTHRGSHTSPEFGPGFNYFGHRETRGV